MDPENVTQPWWLQGGQDWLNAKVSQGPGQNPGYYNMLEHWKINQRPRPAAPAAPVTPQPQISSLLSQLQPQSVMNQEKAGLGFGTPPSPQLPAGLFSFLFGR